MECTNTKVTRAQVEDMISAATTQLLFFKPFFGHIILGMSRSISKRLPAAAGVALRGGGGRVELIVNPELFSAVTDKHRAGIMEHEVLHVVLKHLLRGDKKWDRLRANLAADMVCNPLVGRDNLPEGSVWPTDHGLPENESFEWYYEHIEVEKVYCQGCPLQQQDNKGTGAGKQDQDDKGQGEDKDIDDKGAGSGSQDQQGQDKKGKGSGKGKKDTKQEPKAKIKVKACQCQDIEFADEEDQGGGECSIDGLIKQAQKTAGNLPAGLEQLIQFRKKPEVPWRAVLRRFFGCANVRLDYSKKRTSKRFATRPGVKLKNLPKVCIGVDSSGSISDKELDMFMTECFFAHRAQVADIWVVVCDAEVQQVIHPFEKVTEVKGRGGTHFTPVLNWATDNRVDALIYLTDLYNYDKPLKRPKMPVLWVSTHDTTETPEFGSHIKLPPP